MVNGKNIAKNKVRIKIGYIILSIVMILLLVLIIPFIVLQIRTASLDSEYCLPPNFLVRYSLSGCLYQRELLSRRKDI